MENLENDVIQAINSFGLLVKRIRQEKGISLRQLGDIAHVAIGTIGTLERGEINRIPSFYTVIALCKALDISQDAFNAVIWGKLCTGDNENGKEKAIKTALSKYGILPDRINDIMLIINSFKNADNNSIKNMKKSYG